MTVRGWGGAVVVTAGVAAAAGAAQLGVAYGISVISWFPEPAGIADRAWLSGLTWACWIAATSVVAGAVIGDRLRSRPAGTGRDTVDPTRDPGGPHPGPDPEPGPDGGPPPPSRGLWRLVLAASAALGALVTVALVVVPAREAAPLAAANPQGTAAVHLVVGVLLGAVLAVGALAARAVAANLFATAGWLWALAVALVVTEVAAGRDRAAVPPGFFDTGLSGPWLRGLLLPDAGLALVAAFAIGLLAALPALRRGESRVGVVVSGVTGPLLLVVAYLLAQPEFTTAAATEVSRHLTAGYLPLAGLGGALVATVIPVRGTGRPEDEDDDEDEEEDGDAGVLVPAARAAGAGADPVDR